MHTLSPFADTFGETSNRNGLLAESMRVIGSEGSGVVVVLNPSTPRFMTNIIQSRLSTQQRQQEFAELRDYGVGAQVLAELGVHDMILLTTTHHTPVALAGYDLSIVGEMPIGVRPQ